jgi:hypothetical protein
MPGRVKLIINRDPYPLSGVSMSAQLVGCGRARFGIRFVCLANGRAYPGTLREGPVETCMRSSEFRNKLARVYDCPVRIRLTEKGKVPQLVSVCDPAAQK